MRICVLHSSYSGSVTDFQKYAPRCDPRPWLGEHYVERYLLPKATAVIQVRELVHKGFDVFLNLCDGSWEEDRAGIEVIQALERYGAAFTGGDSGFYEPSREAMKRVCHYADIATPGFLFVRDDIDAAVAQAEDSLRFPLIVKHPCGYGSVGMTRDSRVVDSVALRAELKRHIQRFGGALVEEFIAGRELTVLVVENPKSPHAPDALMPIEYQFPPGETFRHFDLKWVRAEQVGSVRCNDPVLATRLREMARRMFLGMGGVGYGRCDFRVDADGNPFLLEINPNCMVFCNDEPDNADMVLFNDPMGHKGFVEQILASALARQRARRRRWEVRFVPGRGYGRYATEDLAEAMVIDPGERRPHRLLSRSLLARTQDPSERRWLSLGAVPLSADLVATWSDSPEDWKPLAHSCDPNAWFEGLDLVARRPIGRGEQITIDYATVYDDEMADFECCCGAPSCRKIVRGIDCLLPFVQERYGEHVSAWIRRRRQR